MKVLIGGTFNKIHPGHVYLLRKGKSYGELVVVLAHDIHNKKPYAVPAETRKKQLESFGIADKVVIGDPDDYWNVVRKEKPNIILLGYDQELPQAERGKPILAALHINVIRAKKYHDHETRRI